MFKPESISIPEYDIYFEGKVLERNHLKNYRSIQQTICLYSYSFNIINNWPIGFYQFLEKAEKENEVQFKSLIKHGIPKLINTDLWDISKALTNYIAIEKGKLQGKEFIRSDEIKHLYNNFDGRITNCDFISPKILTFKNIEYKIIEKGQVELYVEKFKETYTKEELRTLWGTSPKATFSILTSGLLEDSFSFKTGSVHTWVIPMSSVNNLDVKIKDLSVPYIRHPISFNNALKWIGPEKADIVLRHILDGKIKSKYNTLARTLIDKQDCYYMVKNDVIKCGENAGFISIRDLVFILGVKQSDIDYWIQTGRFGYHKNLNNKNIPIHNFISFHNKFITTLELSFKLNLQIKQILKKHSIGKLKSVSGPELGDGKRLLFYR